MKRFYVKFYPGIKYSHVVDYSVHAEDDTTFVVIDGIENPIALSINGDQVDCHYISDDDLIGLKRRLIARGYMSE